MLSQQQLESAASHAQEILFWCHEALESAHSLSDQAKADQAAAFLKILGDNKQAHVESLAAALPTISKANVNQQVISIAGYSGETAHEAARNLAIGVLDSARDALIDISITTYGGSLPNEATAGCNGSTELIAKSPIADYRTAVFAALQTIPLFDWKAAAAVVRKESSRSVALLASGSDGPTASDQPQGSENSDLEPLDKALALLVRHPEWSDTKIAQELGVNRTTLYKTSWLPFQQARAALSSGQSERPRGEKRSDTGTVEAWDDEE